MSDIAWVYSYATYNQQLSIGLENGLATMSYLHKHYPSSEMGAGSPDKKV